MIWQAERRLYGQARHTRPVRGVRIDLSERQAKHLPSQRRLPTRHLDQDDVRVLLRAIEHDVRPVRRNVEGSQYTLTGEACELTRLPRRKIEQPEIKALDARWQPPVNLGPNVNTAFLDQGAGFFENDEAGVPQLFFTSDRPGGAGALDIYVSALAADGSFGPAVSVSELNSAQGDQRPTIGFDGLEVVFFSNRPGSLGGFDFWTSTRATVFQP
jgi:hypothetical protein